MSERPVLSLPRPRKPKRNRNKFKQWLIAELNYRGESLPRSTDWQQLKCALERMFSKVRR